MSISTGVNDYSENFSLSAMGFEQLENVRAMVRKGEAENAYNAVTLNDFPGFGVQEFRYLGVFLIVNELAAQFKFDEATALVGRVDPTILNLPGLSVSPHKLLTVSIELFRGTLLGEIPLEDLRNPETKMTKTALGDLWQGRDMPIGRYLDMLATNAMSAL